MGRHLSQGGSDHVTTKRPGGMARRKWAVERVKRQLRDVDLWRSSAAEFLATFIFMFIVCITHMIPIQTRAEGLMEPRREIPKVNNNLQTSVGIALTYATLIQCFEHISGGHMNPAVSVAMVIAGHITPLKAAVYSVAQLTGAFGAVALCYGMIPNPSQKLDAVSQLNENLQPLQGFGIEILQTVIVTIAWLATYVTSKSQLGSSALPVGIAYLANSLWASSLTGSSMNPARSLAPAVLTGQWEDLWVYVVGPLTGCIVGAVLYTQIFDVTPKTQRRRKLTTSGRSAEGESVQSDRDHHELMPLNRDAQLLSSSTSNNEHRLDSVVVAPTQRQHPQAPGMTPQPQQGTPRLRHYMQNDVTPQPRLVQRHQTLPSSTRRPNSALQPLRYPPAASSINMTPVTVARVTTRPAPRPNTACGIPLTPRTTADPTAGSRSHAATPCSVFRTLSVGEPFSHSADTLIDNSVL